MTHVDMTPAKEPAARTALRKHVIAAFQALAGAVDRKTAFAQTKAYYRSCGGAWARALS